MGPNRRAQELERAAARAAAEARRAEAERRTPADAQKVVAIDRPAHARPALGRPNTEPHPIRVLLLVLTQCPVFEPRNVDGRAFASSIGKVKK
jgi:hypothetical protein